MEINFVIQQLETITDPRKHLYKNAHKLSDILMIALCATLAGCDDWVTTEAFGNARREWFSTFLELKSGIPSHDTFGRIFSILDPEELSGVYRNLLESFELVDEKIVAIDGKTLRRSHDRSAGVKSTHMVSAWSSENGVVLAQVKSPMKSPLFQNCWILFP